MYNGYAVLSEKLCPLGWHVPTDADWMKLIGYLGGDTIAGGKLKESGGNHWESPNTAATNESGFTGLPGGWLTAWIGYYSLNEFGRWWSATKVDAALSVYILGYNSKEITNENWGYSNGHSIRCIKD